MDTADLIEELICRLARIDSADAWQGDLNPTQRGALDYLARANRFSRSPSHVAAYFGTTRGTMSQTLKTLARKGLVAETRSAQDRRVLSYALTDTGRDALARPGILAQALAGLEPGPARALEARLREVLRRALAQNGGQAFGICRDCRHFEARGEGGYCRLLSVALAPDETAQICHEQSPA